MDSDLIDELQTLAAEGPQFTPRELKNPNNKWLIRSALQKHVRRGQIDRALMTAELLYGVSPAEAWQTLAVIMIEDIGIGDLDLVAYSTVTTLKTFRQNLSEEYLYAAMIQRACEADKSRSACELALGAEQFAIANPTAAWGMLPKVCEEADIQTLNTMFLDKAAWAGGAYFAAREMRKRLRNLGEDALMPALELIMDASRGWGVGDSAARACMMSFERTVDDMNLALFPIINRLMYTQEQTGEMPDAVKETPDWPEEREMLHVSGAAFDMHERRGGKALVQFCNWLAESHPWAAAIPYGARRKAMGAMVFVVEGGMLDQRLVSPDLLEWKELQDRWFPIGWGLPFMPQPEYAAALETVRQNISKLNDFREWQILNAPD